MCFRLGKCCLCLSLPVGVQMISAVGVFSAFVYIVLSLLGGKDMFVLLKFLDLNYFYVGVVVCVVHFFVNFLLWTGAKEKQRFNFIPYLVYTLLKLLLMVSLTVVIVGRMVRFQNVASGVDVSSFRHGCSGDADAAVDGDSSSCHYAGNTTKVVLSVEGFDMEMDVATLAAICTRECQERCRDQCGTRNLMGREFCRVCAPVVGRYAASVDSLGAICREHFSFAKEEESEEEVSLGDCPLERAHLMSRWTAALVALIFFIAMHSYFWLVVYSLYLEYSDDPELIHRIYI